MKDKLTTNVHSERSTPPDAKPIVRRRLRFTFSLYKGHVAQYRWKVWGYQKPKYWEGIWYYAFGIGFGVIGLELE